MKKLITFILALVFVSGLVGCSSAETKPYNVPTTAEVLEEPPALTVTIGKTTIPALQFTYSWRIINADGTITAIEADCAHPLDCEDSFRLFETTETTATLNFTEEPDTILTVQCWSDAHWSDPYADSEVVDINGNTIELKSGGYIYEIIAQWDTERGYGGTAHYAFYIKTV